jgi:hypothetical protein
MTERVPSSLMASMSSLVGSIIVGDFVDNFAALRLKCIEAMGDACEQCPIIALDGTGYRGRRAIKAFGQLPLCDAQKFQSGINQISCSPVLTLCGLYHIIIYQLNDHVD